MTKKNATSRMQMRTHSSVECQVKKANEVDNTHSSVECHVKRANERRTDSNVDCHAKKTYEVMTHKNVECHVRKTKEAEPGEEATPQGHTVQPAVASNTFSGPAPKAARPESVTRSSNDVWAVQMDESNVHNSIISSSHNRQYNVPSGKKK